MGYIYLHLNYNWDEGGDKVYCSNMVNFRDRMKSGKRYKIQVFGGGTIYAYCYEANSVSLWFMYRGKPLNLPSIAGLIETKVVTCHSDVDYEIELRLSVLRKRDWNLTCSPTLISPDGVPLLTIKEMG